MNLFKDIVCSKIRSQIGHSSIHFFVIVMSLFFVISVFSQTLIKSADNGNYALQFDGVDDYVNITSLSSIMNGRMDIKRRDIS
jgi:hypothetical protein